MYDNLFNTTGINDYKYSVFMCECPRAGLMTFITQTSPARRASLHCVYSRSTSPTELDHAPNRQKPSSLRVNQIVLTIIS